ICCHRPRPAGGARWGAEGRGAGEESGQATSGLGADAPSWTTPPLRGSSYALSEFPSLAEVGLEVLGRLGAVGDLSGVGVVMERLARADGDVAQQHGLGQGRGVVEVRERGVGLAGPDGGDPLALLVVVLLALHPGQDALGLLEVLEFLLGPQLLLL